jgi:hypothetical protein
VFKSPAKTASVSIPIKKESEVFVVEGPWSIFFQADRGAPAKATFQKLSSYTENKNAGIKYFSGTATYTKTIKLPKNVLRKGSQFWLDLGEVKDLAEVIVNDKPLGVVWKKPYRVDVSSALRAGKNHIKIKVVNTWVNRLIGDAQPGVKQKITYTTTQFHEAKSPLHPSGLLGPVKIIAVAK